MVSIFIFFTGAFWAVFLAAYMEDKRVANARALSVSANLVSSVNPTTLTNIEALHSAVQRLAAAAENLATAVGTFDKHNWREVMPDVKSAASDVSDAAAEIRAVLGYPDASWFSTQSMNSLAAALRLGPPSTRAVTQGLEAR